jgi:hypothetical protein
MAGFAETIAAVVRATGVQAENIFVKQRLSDLPGFYRPSKAWDLLVVIQGKLLVAIELKSQVGPSFGNNYNNRTEEALGSAVDLWTAYREGALQSIPPPWLGYLFLLEDCPASRSPVRVSEPHFAVREEFRQASYAQRYEHLCRKLVLERQYSAACLLLADKAQASGNPNYTFPAADLSPGAFLTQMQGSLTSALEALNLQNSRP